MYPSGISERSFSSAEKLGELRVKMVFGGERDGASNGLG